MDRPIIRLEFLSSRKAYDRDVEYIGYCKPGEDANRTDTAIWCVCKISFLNGKEVSRLWTKTASGHLDFSQIWNDYTTLTYS